MLDQKTLDSAVLSAKTFLNKANLVSDTKDNSVPTVILDDAQFERDVREKVRAELFTNYNDPPPTEEEVTAKVKSVMGFYDHKLELVVVRASIAVQATLEAKENKKPILSEYLKDLLVHEFAHNIMDNYTNRLTVKAREAMAVLVMIARRADAIQRASTGADTDGSHWETAREKVLTYYVSSEYKEYFEQLERSTFGLLFRDHFSTEDRIENVLSFLENTQEVGVSKDVRESIPGRLSSVFMNIFGPIMEANPDIRVDARTVSDYFRDGDTHFTFVAKTPEYEHQLVHHARQLSLGKEDKIRRTFASGKASILMGIASEDGAVWISPELSGSVVYIGSELLERGVFYELRPGDVVTFGGAPHQAGVAQYTSTVTLEGEVLLEPIDRPIEIEHTGLIEAEEGEWLLAKPVVNSADRMDYYRLRGKLALIADGSFIEIQGTPKVAEYSPKFSLSSSYAEYEKFMSQFDRSKQMTVRIAGRTAARFTDTETSPIRLELNAKAFRTALPQQELSLLSADPDTDEGTLNEAKQQIEVVSAWEEIEKIWQANVVSNVIFEDPTQVQLERISRLQISEKNKSFLRSLVQFKKPVEDERLLEWRDETDKKPYPKQTKAAYNGGTSSWDWFSPYDQRVLWNEFYTSTIEPLLSNEYSDAERGRLVTQAIATFQQRIAAMFLDEFSGYKTALLSWVRGEVNSKQQSDLSMYALPELLAKTQIFFAASGSDAILESRKLLRPGKPMGTTNENGSVVLKELRSDESNFEIPIRNSAAKYRTDQELFKDYVKSIDLGARYISFTLSTKTDIRYNTALINLAKHVTVWNETHPEDPVVLMVDGVQMFGRTQAIDVFKWLAVDGISGVIHSGSKAAGGPPHAGFIYVSKYGERILTSQAYKEAQPGWSFPRFQDSWVNLSIAATLRVIGNIQAIRAMWKLGPDYQLYGSKSLGLQFVYDRFFEKLGLIPLHEEEGFLNNNAIGSIRSYFVPKGVDAKKLLAEWEKYGLIMGGILEETPDAGPILRFGIPIALMKELEANPTLDPVKYVNDQLDELFPTLPKANSTQFPIEQKETVITDSTLHQ